MNITLSSAFKSVQKNKKIQPIGKYWTSGSRFRIFLPMEKVEDRYEAVVNMYYSYQINGKELGEKIYSFNTGMTEEGAPIKNEILEQFATLSPLLVKGEWKKKNEDILNDQKTTTTEKTLKQQQLNKEFGMKTLTSGKVVFEGKAPLVDYLRPIIETECIMVEMNGNAIMQDKVYHSFFSISSGMMDKILTAVEEFNKDIALIPEANIKGRQYLELEFLFGKEADRKEASKNKTITYITWKERLQNTPGNEDVFDTKIKAKLDDLADSSDVIAGRTYANMKTDIKDITGALQAYIVGSAHFLDSIEEDKEIQRIVWTKDIIDKMGLVFQNPQINEALDKAKADEEAKAKGDTKVEATENVEEETLFDPEEILGTSNEESALNY